MTYKEIATAILLLLSFPYKKLLFPYNSCFFLIKIGKTVAVSL